MKFIASWRDKLYAKIGLKILLGISFSIFLMFATIISFYFYQRGLVLSHATYTMEIVSEKTAEAFDAQFELAEQSFQQWFSVDAYGLAIEYKTFSELQVYLRGLLKDASSFESLVLMDTGKRVLVEALRDEGNPSAFNEIGEIIFGSLEGRFIALADRKTPGDESVSQTFVYGAATRNTRGEKNGYLLACFDMHNLLVIMRNELQALDEKGLGVRGAFVGLCDVQSEKIVVHTSDKKTGALWSSLGRKEELIATILHRHDTEGSIIFDQEAFLFFKPPVLISPSLTFSEEDAAFSLLFFLPEKEVLFKLRKNAFFGFIFISLAAFFLMVMASFISQSIVRPIHELEEVMVSVAGGDYKVRAKITSRDEIGYFAEQFNALLEAVQVSHNTLTAYNQNLEQIVADRTKEVARRNEDLVRANKQLERSKTLAQHSAEEWVNTFNAIGEAISVHDVSSKVVRYNEAFKRLFEGIENELFGKECFVLFHEESRRCKGCLFDEMKETLEARSFTVYEKRLGKHLEVTINPIVTEEREYAGCIHIVKDISKRVEMDEANKVLQTELMQSQKMESIGTLAAGIAHEINTPIQFIANNAGFLKEGINVLFKAGDELKRMLVEKGVGQDEIMEFEKKLRIDFLTAELPKALEQSEEGVARVTKIVSAMKDFSHMGTEEMAAEDINKAINSTVDISRNEWKYVAQVKRELGSLPLVECKIGSLKQVFLNLLVNAAHTIADANKEQNREKGLITISTWADDTTAHISITDTGKGIPDEIRERVFDHFFTTKEVGKGTGQGLSLAYSTIAEAHGGKIWFESVGGEGTTFFIDLPIKSSVKKEEGEV